MFIDLDRFHRNDEATMFVKNFPWSATKDTVSQIFGNDVKVNLANNSHEKEV